MTLANYEVKQLNEYIQRLLANERRKESALENGNKRLLDEGNYARQQNSRNRKEINSLRSNRNFSTKSCSIKRKTVKEVEAGENSSTKLPKLVIAPFNG